VQFRLATIYEQKTAECLFPAAKMAAAASAPAATSTALKQLQQQAAPSPLFANNTHPSFSIAVR